MTGTVVAVIGGGYGGSAVAKALDEDTDVVLIEPKDAFVHAAGSLRALVQPDWASNMFFPYDKLLRRGKVVRERAASVDSGGVTLASGARVDADYVVLASGSGYPYPAKTDTDVTSEALERLRVTHDELDRAERVLLVGAGPVGLELAGEIKAVWPDKHVTVVDPAEQLMPGFLPEVREELHRQLGELGVELRLGTGLAEEPPSEPGQTKTFTVGTRVAGGEDTETGTGTGTGTGSGTGSGSGSGTGDSVTADIWFRCYGVRVTGDYLGEDLAAARTPRGVRVTETLNVQGHSHIYALGDLADLAEAKMAGNAMQHAEVVAQNIVAQVRGARPEAVYRPAPAPSILLPLGPKGGTGQLGAPDGATVLPAETVSEYKGTDLLTGRFAELFGTA